jgi:hypothetical protein
MSGLNDAAKEAREHTDTCTDPSCHALANALETAETAEAQEQLSEFQPEHDVEGIPSPAESGFVSEIHIPPGGDQN